jgi:zinc transporter 2
MIGGYLSNSIAIFTDCAHLATDMIGFMMSMLAMRISLNPSTEQMTFGWHRAEVIGTLMSVAFLVIVTVWLVVEATDRFINPTPIEPVSMLITAVGSIVMNLIMIQILHSGDNPYHLGGGNCDHSHSHGEGEDHGHSHSHGGGNDEESKKEGEDTQIEESKDESAPLLDANNNKKEEPRKPK